MPQPNTTMNDLTFTGGVLLEVMAPDKERNERNERLEREGENFAVNLLKEGLTALDRIAKLTGLSPKSQS